MTEMSPQAYPQQQQQHGYQPQPGQGYPGQQPWADPQQQPAPNGYAPPHQQPAPNGYAPPHQQPAPYGYAPPHQQPQYPQEYPTQAMPTYQPQAYPQQLQQPQGYPQQPQQQPPHPTQNPNAANLSNELQCRFCGSYPAKQATLRGHRGIIVVMQFLSQKGPFCRDCGISTFRSMTSRTLVQGWWGYASFIITPFTLLWNLLQRLKFNGMLAPRPAPDGNSVAPMPLGKPVFLRPTIVGLLVPLLAIGAIGYAIVSGGSQNYVGQCIKLAGSDNVDFVSCDKPNDGRVISVVNDESQCSSEATGAVERVSRSRSGRETRLDVLCVK